MAIQITFNLLFDPWIPVVTLDGAVRTVSLRELLFNAPAYRGVSAPLPHTNAAILRLLLAVLHRCFGPAEPSAWEPLWRKGAFDAEILDRYFEEQRENFDLFSPTRPFYQNRQPLVEEKPAQVLLQAVGGGDTFTLFDHVLDSTPVALTPAEAALALLTAQSFGLAGLCHPQHKLVYTDAPCSRAVVFFVEGKTLFETLMFNLIRYNPAEPIAWRGGVADRPAWEAANPYLPERTRPLGYLDHLTWPSRRITLIPEERDGQIRVTRITTAPGLSMGAGEPNPMYHYNIRPGKKPGDDPEPHVLRFSEGRALWRDSYALLNLHSDEVNAPRALGWVSELAREGILPHPYLQVAAYGMCTEPGKQKVYFYRGERFEINDALLREPELVKHLGTALERAEALRRELWSVLAKLATLVLSFQSDHPDGRKPDPKDVQNLVQHWDAEGLYWNRLEVPFYAFLADLPAVPPAALLKWDERLRAAVREAYQQTAAGLGASRGALKAAAKTHGWLNYGITKVLGAQPQGENDEESSHATTE